LRSFFLPVHVEDCWTSRLDGKIFSLPIYTFDREAIVVAAAGVSCL